MARKPADQLAADEEVPPELVAMALDAGGGVDHSAQVGDLPLQDSNLRNRDMTAVESCLEHRHFAVMLHITPGPFLDDIQKLIKKADAICIADAKAGLPGEDDLIADILVYFHLVFSDEHVEQVPRAELGVDLAEKAGHQTHHATIRRDGGKMRTHGEGPLRVNGLFKPGSENE